MTITLPPELEALLEEKAQQQGITIEELVLTTLREEFLPKQRKEIRGIVPADDWEDKFLSSGKNYGVGLSDEAVSREAMYD